MEREKLLPLNWLANSVQMYVLIKIALWEVDGPSGLTRAPEMAPEIGPLSTGGN